MKSLLRSRLLTFSSLCLIWSALVPPAEADLIGWWPLNGSVRQGAGEPFTTTLLGGATFDDAVPSPVGAKVLRLGGGNLDGFKVDADPALDVDEFTLGYFINQNGAVQEGAGLERLTSREGDTFETAVGDASAVGGTSSSTGTTLSYYQGGWNVTDVEIPEDEWVHVVWKNTTDEMQLYLNGALEYTGPALPPGAGTGFMNVGVRHNNIEGFEGLIDDVFFWDDSENPLSEEAIAAIASGGMAAFLGFDEDSDGDGLPDVWETANGLDPDDDGAGDPANGAEGDPDGDGLNNEGEFENGTLAQDDDSDDDGVKDNDELLAGTDPLDEDTDSDGLSDGDEVVAGTKPKDPDTDGDGFQDGFELANGSDPLDEASVPGAEGLLVVHLTFDGGLDDDSGNSNDGIAIGDPSFDDTVPENLGGGQALRLAEGDVDGVTLEANDLLNSSPFTLAYFINPDGSPQGNAGLERLTSRTGDGFETAIGDANAVGGTSSDTGLTLSYYEGTGWMVTDVTIPLDDWTHIAWRNDGDGPDDMQLFINGQLEYTGQGVPAARLSGLMNIGIRHNNVEGFDGLMDDFRLYATSLSDADIAAIAAGDSGGGYSLAFTAITRSGSGDEPRSVELKWASQPGRLYAIDYSLDFANWLELSDSHASQGAETTYTDDTVSADNYRVRRN
ncbi:MAG: hypothetical protein KDN22_33400 [Verrucomicrobiae bacterium]|nr:hypothetical protein [Verrucomicrobiae bacterium]